jgi:CBS domain-containing membrane protein
MIQPQGTNVNISQAELESRAIELSPGAFEVFCNDMASMLGCEITGADKGAATVTLADLKKRFKKLVTVATVQAQGVMNGSFYLILDQEALFTLAGTLVMLPDKVILQNRKHGTFQDANEMGDAVGEIGNLMVGSWDRVFREEYEGHGHFALSKNFIGSPWDNPEEAIGLTTASQLQAVNYEIKVKEFAMVACAVVYPKDLFEPKPVEQVSQTEIDEDVATDNQLSPVADGSANHEPSARPDNIAVDVAVAIVPDTASVQLQSLETACDAIVPQTREVSESIRKITSSPAILPGQQSDTGIGIAAQALNAMSVQDVMRRDVVWASPDETVEQAFAKMQQKNVSYVLVGSKGALEGIVSKSDIRGAMSPYLQEMFSQWRRPLDLATLQIRLKWVMSKPVYTIRPDASFGSLVRKMEVQKIRAMPVVDGEGAVVGVVTAFEIFQTLARTA